MALLFNVSDLVAALETKVERAERAAARERMLVNAQRTRELAERARLDAEQSRR